MSTDDEKLLIGRTSIAYEHGRFAVVSPDTPTKFYSDLAQAWPDGWSEEMFDAWCDAKE